MRTWLVDLKCLCYQVKGTSVFFIK
jgi:hypothetical protein